MSYITRREQAELLQIQKKQSLSGVKHDQDKPRLELLPSDALVEVAKVLAFGAKKYDANNWRGGFKWTRLFGSVQRHLHAWNAGEDKDNETDLTHLAHAACGILFLLEHELKRLGEDDRYKY